MELKEAAPKTFAESISKKQVVWLVIACLAYVAVLLLPLGDLSVTGQRALAALAWIIIVLISNCLPTMLANCVFAAIIILSGVLPQGAFLTAFGTSPFMLVLGLGVVAMGMSKTNLGARVSYTLMKTIGRTPPLLLLAIMLTEGILSALIANLPALLAVCPIIISVLKALNQEPGKSDLSRAMFIGMIWAGGAGGLCFISSAATNAAGVGAISAASEGAVTVSFAQFAVMGVPTGIVLLISGWIFLTLWFKLHKSSLKIAPEVLDQKLKELGRMDAAEGRYILYLVLLIVLFFVGGNYGIMPPTVAIIFMAVMLCPKIGLITWKEAQAQQNWGMLFQIGFFVGFAGAISNTGLGDWLAHTLFGWVNTSNPLLLLLIVVCIGHIANILVPGGGAALVVIPSVWALSVAAGLNNAYLSLMMVFVVCWSQFQPVQPQYLVVKGNTGGYLDVKDFLLPNIFVTLVWTVLLVPLFYLLAPVAGIL